MFVVIRVASEVEIEFLAAGAIDFEVGNKIPYRNDQKTIC